MPSGVAWAVYRGQTHGSAPTTKALKFLCIEIAEASCLGAACGQARYLTYISLKWEFLYTIKLGWVFKRQKTQRLFSLNLAF